MTETKLKHSNRAYLTNLIYKIYSSNFIPTNDKQREASLGTAIAIHNTLNPYIHDIKTFPGTAIYIDLFLPKKNKTRIISIYIPNDHTELANQTQKTINS